MQPNKYKQPDRILGIDLARALAIIGMIIVNFKVVFGENGLSWVKSFASIFDGKAAAIFVVLAGIGMALMTNSALKNNDRQELKIIKIKIVKRALFLFLVGLICVVIWPADILHFYGIYMLIILLLLTDNEKTILITAIVLILLYPLFIVLWNYETGRNFDTLEYLDFWTFNGFLRNLFLNGFHPVIPWTAFILFGFWFGKQDLKNVRYIKKAFWVSSIIFILFQILSYLTISFISEGNKQIANELSEIIGTNPMPPLPIYMFNGIAASISIISACIILGKRFSTNKIILALNKTGQLSLTFYVLHIIIGIGIIREINPEKMKNYPIEFSVAYALVFSLLCILFANFWLKNRENGPIEWIMRKIIK